MHLSYFKPFKKWELLLKKGIYSQKEQILTLKGPIDKGGKYFHVGVISLEGVSILLN